MAYSYCETFFVGQMGLEVSYQKKIFLECSGGEYFRFWMWKKLLKLRSLAIQLTRKEISSGASTSFWYEKWSPLDQLIELTGDRGSMDLGIPKTATVEKAIQLYRARGHRVHALRLIGQEILRLKNRWLNQLENVCLCKRDNGDFKNDFITSHTWNLTRISLQ